MSKENYAFRLRYTRSPRKTLECPEQELRLPAAGPGDHVKLKAVETDKTIKTTRSLALVGTGWATAEDAQRIGLFYTDILARTCARLGLGSDFGERTARKGWFTKEGLELVSRHAGVTVMNDVHGLMVYDQTSHPIVAFAAMRGDVVVGINPEQFLSVFRSALDRPRDLSKQERAALVLFNTSFFPDSPDGRFMLLMMAAEALFEPRPQSDAITAVVQGFMSAVNAEISLKPNEKKDLRDRLGQLQRESFRQAGRRMVKEKLSDRTYKDISAEDFFNLCYDLRSSLAHGKSPLPTLEEIKGVAAPLESMLSDLLSTDLLDVGPQVPGNPSSELPNV